MKLRKLMSLLLALVMVMSMVACGAKKEEAPAADAPAADAPAADAPAADAPAADAPASDDEGPEWATVRVAMPRGLECLDDAQFWSAVYLGFFEEEHINFELVGTSGSDVVKMLAEGQVELACPAPNVTFTGLAAGMEMVSVFQDGYCNIFGLALPADSDIDSWDDLNGKTIASNSATSYMTVDPMITAGGGDPSTVTYVVAGDQRSVMLAEGQVDAAYTWQKEWQNWKAQGLDIVYLDGEDVVKNCSNSLCCTPEYYENNKDVLERFGRALAKGYMFCKLNPLAAAAIVTSKFPSLGLTPEQAVPSIEAAALISIPESNKVGGQELSRWQVCLELAIQQEVVAEGDIDLEALLRANEFVEAYNSYDMAELEKIAAEFDINSISW